MSIEALAALIGVIPLLIKELNKLNLDFCNGKEEGD